ncbi:MAG: M48 family metalloprotease [Acidobacteriota bacterium]|nr:M48 family metalloprotease [Acidobacteriota bacterium]
MPGWGSDASAANPAEVPSTSTSIKKNSKYDIDSIGQRSVGKGMNLYSIDKERALGEAMAATIDRNTKFVADQEVFDYVNRLGRKLARSSDAEVPFTIRVIDSPDLNVFSLPGGFLYVAKGLIMELDNEAELAGLMAHEIAHVAARHASKTASRRYAWNMAAIPLSQVAGPAGLGVKQIASLTFKKISRDSENEADLLGIEYQYTAGYDPQAFLEALEKLHAKEVQKRGAITKISPAFGFIAKLPLHDRISRAFSNYPATEERIERVQGEIATLLPSRTEYVTDSSEFQEVKARLGLADLPILHHHHAGDGVSNPPILHRGAR